MAYGQRVFWICRGRNKYYCALQALIIQERLQNSFSPQIESAMNSKPDFLKVGIPFVLFLIPAMLFFTSCSNQVEPEIPVGSWSATQETTVRFKAPREPFRFVSDTVNIHLARQ